MDSSLHTKYKLGIRGAIDLRIDSFTNHLCLVHHPFVVRKNKDLAIEMLGGLRSIKEVLVYMCFLLDVDINFSIFI